MKVDMDVVAAALQVVACGLPVPVPLYEGCPLLMSPIHLPAGQDNPLQNEDSEEANSHDKLWKGEADLLERDLEKKLFHLRKRQF